MTKQQKKRKMTSESIDINPDYGYNQDGVEYEESALKDANLDYAYSVDDPEYMETGVTLTIIVALMKMRTTKMKNQMGRKSNQCWHAKKLTCFLLFQ